MPQLWSTIKLKHPPAFSNFAVTFTQQPIFSLDTLAYTSTIKLSLVAKGSAVKKIQQKLSYCSYKPHCELETEDSKPAISHDAQPHSDAQPYKVWLQMPGQKLGSQTQCFQCPPQPHYRAHIKSYHIQNCHLPAAHHPDLADLHSHLNIHKLMIKCINKILEFCQYYTTTPKLYTIDQI